MQTRPVPKVLGLFALVVSALAIGTAGTAQAETGACFGYKSGAGLACFKGSLEADPNISIEGLATLLIANVNLEVRCQFANNIEGGTLGANGSISLGRLEFNGCFSYTNTPKLTLLNSCTPKDPLSGSIRTEKGTGLIVLHGGQAVVKLSPDSGTTLAKIFLGEECAVAEELIVTGNLVLEETGFFSSHAIYHYFREFPNLQLMKVGVNKATIDGSANVTLSFEHFGLEWAGKAA